MTEPLCAAILEKIQEQIELADHLISILPAEYLTWSPVPEPDAWPVGRLLGHLLDCLAGFCAVLAAAAPEQLAHFAQLRERPVNHLCSSSEARERITVYRAHIDEGLGVLQDADLGRMIPTVFVSEGEPLLTLLLGNLEHFINHKHQLFVYLKLMGVKVGTRDLYRFRTKR